MLVKVLLAVLIIGIITTVIFLNVKAKTNYNRGFKAGVLVSFWWVETNTSCKDAFSTYMCVVKEHPEDGIYVMEVDKNGSMRFPKKPELVSFLHK